MEGKKLDELKMEHVDCGENTIVDFAFFIVRFSFLPRLLDFFGYRIGQLGS